MGGCVGEVTGIAAMAELGVGAWFSPGVPQAISVISAKANNEVILFMQVIPCSWDSLCNWAL